MKKITCFLLFFGAWFASAFAQSAYLVTPTPAQVVTLPTEIDNVAHAKIKNVSNAPVTITWQRQVVSLHDSMYTLVCDPTTCYGANVSTQTFTLMPQDSGEMDIHFINEFELATTGLVRIKLTNVGNPADTLRVSYFFDSQTLDAKNPLPKATVKMYPNPFAEYMTLENAEAVGGLRLYALDGRQVAYQVVNGGQRYTFDGVPTGRYWLALETKEGRVFQTIDVQKQ